MVQSEQKKISTGSTTLRELVKAKERLAAATQKQKVLAHLLTLGKISPLEAFGVYGIFRLASCIYDLKKDGFEIQTILKRDLNKKPYAVYKLKSYGSTAE